MALQVETGSGAANSESYAAVADADSYFTARANAYSATWAAATTPQKEAALRVATQYLDAHYNGRWKGTRVTRTQALLWPRGSAYDNDGFILSSVVIYPEIIQATIELAGRAVGTTTVNLSPDPTPGAGQVKRKKAGPVEIEYHGAFNPSQSYPFIDAMLSSFLTSSGQFVELIRQ